MTCRSCLVAGYMDEEAESCGQYADNIRALARSWRDKCECEGNVGTRYRIHPHVPHPREMAQAPGHWNDRLLDFMSAHILASRVMFDIALVIPLLALPASTSIKVSLGVISGSWIQWWALPSLQRTGNIADRKREAKADADHEALTHIATVQDHNTALLRQLIEQGGK